MPKPKLDQTECWLVYFDGTVRWEILEEPENCRKTDRVIRRGKYVGSSVDYRGGGVRLARHARAAISKRTVKSGSAMIKNFVEKELRPTSAIQLKSTQMTLIQTTWCDTNAPPSSRWR